MNVALYMKFFSRISAGLLLFFVLLFGNQAVTGQQVSSSFKINWMGIRTFYKIDSSAYECMFFEGAQFSVENINLPLFTGLVELPGLSDAVGARVTDPVYRPLTETEIQTLQGISVSSEILCSVSTEIERKVHFGKVVLCPLRNNPLTNNLEKLISFNIKVDYILDDEKYAGKSKDVNQSVLASGNWYKLGLTSNGIYKITYADLVNMGITPESVNPKNIRIYGNGGGMLPEANSGFRYEDLVENPILVSGENDGVFNTGDYILFYAKGPDSWTWNSADSKFSKSKNIYSDYSYYFLTADLGPGKRISLKQSLNATPTNTVDRFNDYAVHEKEELNMIKSGKMWLGEVFDLKTTYDITPFNFPNIDGDAKLNFEVSLVAKSASSSVFKVFVNGGEAISTVMASTDPGSSYYFASFKTETRKFYLNTPVVNVRVTYIPSVSNSVGWLDYIEFNVTRFLKMYGNQMSFRNTSCVGTGNITEFTISNCQSSYQIWDVTDITDIQQQQAQFQSDKLSFIAATDILREYIIFNGNEFLTVSNFQKISNQNLHSLNPVDLIIVAHPDFLSQAQSIKTIHESEGLSALITTPALIYNEFSSGAQDISAIRDFIKMLYDRASAGNEPKYVLLFGDASYDYKNRKDNNTNFIPSFESTSSLAYTESYVSDDFYGLMDLNEGRECDGTLDLGIGRFPVKSQSEANAAVNKVEYYMGLKTLTSTNCSNFSSSIQRLGDWRNQICFVADDQNVNTHLHDADALARYIDSIYPNYNIDKIYFDSYTQYSTPGGQRYPDVTKDINERVAKGAVLINYTGHGGETGWAHERVLEISDINSWSNTSNMAVFLTATCEFSRFDDPERTSAGEYIFLNPLGGGISLFTTTRLSMSSTNFDLNLHFCQNAFKKTSEGYPRMGDLMRKAKNPSSIAIRNFVLLGDPALMMAYPQYNVVTETINGQPAASITDTIKAYSKVTVTGYISDEAGNKQTSFNGLLFPSVYCPPVEVTTLGNDPDSYPQAFSIQKNIIYKGKVSVVNGDFSFTFVVPRDIAYSFNKGRISYYAQDGTTDANGAFEEFMIGGSEALYNNDLEGPYVELFMNDTSFRFGGLTDENPVLIARIIDSSGVNTAGIGIGHDIVAVMDDNTSQSINLNDYYQADLNSYQSGNVLYPYYNLSNGLHNLRVKVWDIFNNSGEAYTEFLVAESGDLVLENILNYPNPFTDQTVFTFQHNHPCCNLDVDIKIYDINGRIVKDIHETVATNGFNGGPIEWDGANDAGAPVPPGMYLYRLTITTEEGYSYEKSNKLIVLR